MPRGHGSLTGASRPRPIGCALEAAPGFFRGDGEVTFVNCTQWTFEIMEYARAGMPANPKLQDHLRHCARCAQRWEDERGLSARFRALRGAAARRQSESRRE